MVGFTGIYLEAGTVFNPVEGNAGYLEIGRYPQGIDSRAEQVTADIEAAGFAVSTHAKVMAAKGAKMIGNLANALNAITDGKGDSDRYVQRAREEGERCLRAEGLPLEDRSELQRRAKARRGVNRLPEDLRNLGSSWQSLMRGQGSTEADYLNGEIVRLGRLHGIPTPFNRVLQIVAGQMARRREKPGIHDADELYRMAVDLVGSAERRSGAC